MGTEKYDRRVFLRRTGKTLQRIAAGVAAGEIMVQINPRIDQGVQQATGILSGNANRVDKDFKSDQPDWGVGLPVNPEGAKKYNQTVGPALEEFMYRMVPSGAVSTLDDREEPAMDILVGTGGIKMSRRELIGGTITTGIFATTHNFTEKGFNTRVFPVSLLFGGGVLWYLQRKLGAGANIIAHLWFNNRRPS